MAVSHVVMVVTGSGTSVTVTVSQSCRFNADLWVQIVWDSDV